MRVGVGRWFPLGEGTGEGQCPVSRIFFLVFDLKMVNFGAF